MGPPPFGDGKGRPGSGRRRHSSRFNGATAFRRWKGAPGRVSAALAAGRFNGATAFRRWKVDGLVSGAIEEFLLQWGHRLSAMESSTLPGGYLQLRHASMGPPPFGDGKSSPAWWPAPSQSGFNGATAFRRWKDHDRHDAGHQLAAASMGPPPFGDGKGRTADVVTDSQGLQWGHRLSAMESITVAHVLSLSVEASMGPPPFGDGKRLTDS